MTPSSNHDALSADADLMIDIAAGVVDARTAAGERRTDERYPYDTAVGLVTVDDRGTMHDASVLNARNISVGGICLVGRQCFTPGSYVLMQLVRSDGSAAIVGARTQHCRYIGDMCHETGFLFTPMPAGVNPEALIQRDGRLRSLFGTDRSPKTRGQDTDQSGRNT